MFFQDISPNYLAGHGINPEGLVFGPYFLPYNPCLKQFSRNLRQGYQLAEVKLWNCFRTKSLGYAFRRQYPILNYIADFYCKELNLVVEIDGYTHFSEEAQKHDAERDRQMRAIGLKVIRVNDNEVRKDAEQVARWIIEEATEGREVV